MTTPAIIRAKIEALEELGRAVPDLCDHHEYRAERQISEAIESRIVRLRRELRLAERLAKSPSTNTRQLHADADSIVGRG